MVYAKLWLKSCKMMVHYPNHSGGKDFVSKNSYTWCHSNCLTSLLHIEHSLQSNLLLSNDHHNFFQGKGRSSNKNSQPLTFSITNRSKKHKLFNQPLLIYLLQKKTVILLNPKLLTHWIYQKSLISYSKLHQ